MRTALGRALRMGYRCTGDAREVGCARLGRLNKCKLCSVGELNERLDCKSMEIKWNIYMKVDP